MTNDDRNSSVEPNDYHEIFQTPEDRFAEDNYTTNEVRTKVILTPEEVAAMGGQFPFIRIVVRYVNGEPIEEIQELYRFDASGRLVRNDDVVGISWTGLPIPHDRLAECPDHYDRHKSRLVFLGIDGKEEYGTVLCDQCLAIYEQQLQWERYSLGLIFKAIELKERKDEGQRFFNMARSY